VLHLAPALAIEPAVGSMSGGLASLSAQEEGES
jgi:hypothetical protein